MASINPLPNLPDECGKPTARITRLSIHLINDLPDPGPSVDQMLEALTRGEAGEIRIEYNYQGPTTFHFPPHKLSWSRQISEAGLPNYQLTIELRNDLPGPYNIQFIFVDPDWTESQSPQE